MIEVFDNLITPFDMSHLYRDARNADFKIGWADTDIIEQQADQCLSSEITLSQYLASPLRSVVESSEITKHIEGYMFRHAVINLSMASHKHHIHTHSPDEKVVLYYLNLEWQSDWSGDTVFYNNNNSEIIKTVKYKPGRITVFNGDVNHCIRPQAMYGPLYRFSITVFLMR